MENYIEKAKRTLSPNFTPLLVKDKHLFNVLNQAIAIGNELDKIKKAMFYGKAFNTPVGMSSSLCKANYKSMPVDLIHAIIGSFTEASEKLQALKITLFEGKAFDTTNYKEEVGDGLWYDAIGLDSIQCTFDEAMQINIKKLKARYPEKFTEEKAETRDLFAEREVLEK